MSDHPFMWKTIWNNIRYFGTILEVIGWISILPFYFFIMPLYSLDSYCISTISRNISPDGRIYGVVIDCWPQLPFGGQVLQQELVVNLVRPEGEKNLTSTTDSCDAPETALVSISEENLKNRPLLHWLAPNHLEVMIPDKSEITLYRTSREGVIVDFVFENTDEQKQRRRNETSGEIDDIDEQFKYLQWKCI